MKTIYFINLTNGLVYYPDVRDSEHAFIRIQSTACEQKRWEFILNDLDGNLLVNLALGNRCIICDSGKRGVTRAQWQGVEWIRYALNRAWYNRQTEVNARRHNVTKYFSDVYASLDKKTIRRLKYYGKFLHTTSPNLEIMNRITNQDGDSGYFKELLWEHMK